MESAWETQGTEANLQFSYQDRRRLPRNATKIDGALLTAEQIGRDGDALLLSQDNAQLIFGWVING